MRAEAGALLFVGLVYGVKCSAGLCLCVYVHFILWDSLMPAPITTSTLCVAINYISFHDCCRTYLGMCVLYRYMYWSEEGVCICIKRAGMDGSNHTILHNTGLELPYGITIDYENQKIYWVDSHLGTLEYSNVDGTERTLLQGTQFQPFSITLNGEFLFWTDWQEFAIFTSHKDVSNDTIVSLYDQLSFQPFGIEAVTPDRQINGMKLSLQRNSATI